MYQFKTKTGKTYMTDYSPKDIAQNEKQFFCAYDDEGDSIYLLNSVVDFYTFEFLKNY